MEHQLSIKPVRETSNWYGLENGVPNKQLVIKQTACDLHPILSGTNHATHATPSRDGRFGHHSGDHGIEFHAHSLSLFPGSAAGAAALK